MKRCLTIAAIIISISAFAQDDKMPSQTEIQAMMKDAQKQLDNLDPETKHMMDSLGIKMPDMKAAAKNISKVSQADLQKEWDRQTRTVPLKDATRIASIAATPSTANISAYIKSTQTKLLTHLKPASKNVGDKLYASFKSSGKTTQEIGNAAAGLWMTAKAQMAFYILSKACADDASNANNISNYAAMISMSGNEEIAIPLLNNLNARFPKNNIILNNLGQAWFGLGDVVKAGKYLDSAIMILGAHTQAKLTKAKIEESKGNKTEAIKLVKEAVLEAYSKDKDEYLNKLGYKLKVDDVKLPANKKHDLLNLGGFQPPPFPKTVIECVALEDVWKEFNETLKKAEDQLKAETNNSAENITKATMARIKNGESLSPIHLKAAQLKMNEAEETFIRKLDDYKAKIIDFNENKGRLLRKEYDETMNRLKKEDNDQTGEGKPNVDYCPMYRDASNKFLGEYNAAMESFYKDLLMIHKVYYNEVAYYSIYATMPEQLNVAITSLKASWLFTLRESHNFESITSFVCDKKPESQDTSNMKLAEFDDVACQYHSELNLIFGSITIDCSRMKTELDMGPVKLGLKQDMDKENFMDQFVSCTAELTAGVGKAEIGDVIGIGPEIGGGMGIEIDRNGVSDVYVIGKAQVGVEVGAFEQSSGFEGRISLISGAYSGGFEINNLHMKYIITFIILFLNHSILFAQKETLDYASYTPPTGWAEEVKESSVVYSIVNKTNKTWCQIAVFKNTTSKGNIDNDFNSEWNTLVKPLGVTGDAQTSAIKELDGWTMKSGAASFNFNGSKAISSLISFSGYNNCFSIVANTNSADYIKMIEDFVGSVRLSNPVVAKNNIAAVSTAVNTNYAFNTTNFNDGYTSTVQTDWIEVTKGNLKALIHYQNAISQWYNPNRDVEDKQIWDNVIATRYSNINNYEHLLNNASYEIIHFMAANATDKNGKQVFVALYKKGGINSTWLEYIFPDRAAFTQTFGIDKYDWRFDGWEPLAKIYNYNKFAVSPKDLVGLWTNDFSSMTQYYNVYTGNNAGTKSYQSAQDYNFTSTTNYSWKIQVVSGFVGSFDQQHAASKGTFSMPDNWSIYFSDMEGKPKTYAVQFTAIKGGRILWINGNAFVKK